ncbi:hypothetical protein GCM10022222_03870 [Amycolatopsis ultiminotia]|uniref:CsbD-like domain-containing protein n=1 Tax=Amycolatopsis ultiminotia TaxID=543629 RepID=A0ABP6UYX3_9PSEU
MSLGDKFGHKADELGGKAKEAAGRATGDEELTGEGQNDQAKAGVKKAAEDIKDSVGEAGDKLKNAFKKD